jgi:hypothetical protein
MMLLLAAQALYVGNNACEPCHAEILRAYSATPMAKSSGAVQGGLNAGTFRHPDSKTDYRIQSSGVVTATRGALKMQRQLDYFIGSGSTGQSFLYLKDRFLFQAPVTWYSQLARWDVSPGYEKDQVSRWNRPIEPECLNCHSSQIRSSPAFQNLYADPPFAQAGVGCERCHGPGSDHVQGKGPMVNPAKLQPAKRDSVCAQCHMSGEVRINRAGRSWMEYRPGSLLSDFAAYFVTEGASELKATSYVEKLSASQCKLASGDKLWCGTCHDPHRVPAQIERTGWYRTKCLSCHATDFCGRTEDCTTCHMPKRKVVDVNHGVLTDHSIPRIPTGITVTKNHWTLAPFSAENKGDRELGLAYATLFLRTGDPRQESEAMRLLSAAPLDLEVQFALANLSERRGNFSRAFSLYQSGNPAPGFAPALIDLGVYFGVNGKVKDAITIWRGVLKQNLCAEEAGINLIKALEFQRDREGVSRIREAQSGCVF